MTSDGRISVLHICDHLGWESSRMHGVKRLFSWMLPRFDPARFQVSLVSLRRKDLSEETLDKYGVDISYLGRSRFNPLTLADLSRIFRERRVDIVHMHGYGATTFGRLAGALHSVPTVLHEHCNLGDSPWFQKIADKALAPFTDVAIAVSKSTVDFTVHVRQLAPERVKLVYLGAPVGEFGAVFPQESVAATRAALGLAAGEVAVGTVTRLQEQKGNRYLIDAAKLVTTERPNLRFFLVGEGPLRGELEAQAIALGLGDRFVFTGFRSDIPALLATFDVSVFPSLWEGTPLTAFESLAAGKPIVATNADGLSDILTHGHDAVIVPARDSAALARAILWTVDHPDEAARLGAQARETARKYDIDAFVRKMERLYELLHARSRATGRRAILSADISWLTAS